MTSRFWTRLLALSALLLLATSALLAHAAPQSQLVTRIDADTIPADWSAGVVVCQIANDLGTGCITPGALFENRTESD